LLEVPDDERRRACIKYGVRTVTDVLALAGVLEDDRVPPVERWFTGQVATLPEQMRGELAVWLTVMREGSTIPPRFRPRADTTIRTQLRYALPVLHAWTANHTSLREVSRDDVRAAVPPSGSPRSLVLTGLRSIFRVLKARQLVFVNPTARLHAPVQRELAAAPVDLDTLRAALDSDDTTRAALAALLAFHAVRAWRLGELLLTDVRDGRLHVGDQVVLLAEPVRQRLRAYLDDRQRCWPNSANPHLFIHYRNAGSTRPATAWWVRKRLGMSPQAIRQDRILDEAHASRGDVRRVCDLFGLSIAGAYRYTVTASHAAINESRSHE
jgi:hypothetical protein